MTTIPNPPAGTKTVAYDLDGIQKEKDSSGVIKPFTAIHLLGKLTGFDLNSTADQAITLSGGTKYALTDVLITNASTAGTTADVFQIWTGATQSGNEMCYSFNGFATHLSSSNSMINGNIRIINAYRSYLNMNPGFSTCGNTLYASLGTPEGSALTADIYVFGYILA